MSKGAISFLVLVSLSAFSALVFHWRIRNYVRASCGAALAATVAFQIAGFFYLGYLDPFFFVALLSGGVVGLAVAFIIGAPFLTARRKGRKP